jgi:hypothetical protein
MAQGQWFSHKEKEIGCRLALTLAGGNFTFGVKIEIYGRNNSHTAWRLVATQTR